MARPISKGTCTSCQKMVSKAGMTRHLASCEQRAARRMEAEHQPNAQHNRTFHLLVEGSRLPMYWMHLAVSVESTLAELDHFLRGIWLECCGHLSAFEIEGIHYRVDGENGMYDWDPRGKHMQVPLETVLRPGQRCSYDYDFGTTTELRITVLAEERMDMEGKAVQILARNRLLCHGCGEPATRMCMECVTDDCLCEICAAIHPCGKEATRPLVNSPRMGVCGYTGRDRAVVFW